MERDPEKAAGDVRRPRNSYAISFGFRKTLLDIPPPPPEKDEGYRPMTSSTKRFSYLTTSSRRTIKYAKGKFSGVELSPQPSDDPEDPLNWPRWRKELNYAALLMTCALTSGMKTAFVSTNSTMATRYGVSYSSTTLLTAVPLIVSAFSGLVSLTAAKLCGKRPVYLGSMILVFVGSMWNMGTLDNYSQCMAARVFQGLGWGAFDTLILGSIQDTFFEHERNLRIAIYQVTSTAILIGGPLFGGLASRNAGRFTLQFEIINSFYLVAIPFLVLGAAETVYDRSWSTPVSTPASTLQTPPKLIPRGRIPINTETVLAYLRTIPLVSYSGEMSFQTILQGPRAFVAPTTILLVAATLIPYATMWGFSQSLALLFSPAPFSLSESELGSLMAAPFVLSVVVMSGFYFYPNFRSKFTLQGNALALCAGAVLSFTGILAFGLEINAWMSEMPVAEDGSVGDPAREFVSTRVRFSLISILLGFLSVGVFVFDSTVNPLIWRSTQFTSSNLNVCLRNVADMDAGVTCWRNLFAGVFVAALPRAFESTASLKSHAIGLSVTQALLACGLAAVWWFYDQEIRGLDGRVMGLVDLSMLRRTGSFFDHD